MERIVLDYFNHPARRLLQTRRITNENATRHSRLVYRRIGPSADRGLATDPRAAMCLPLTRQSIMQMCSLQLPQDGKARGQRGQASCQAILDDSELSGNSG